METRVIRDVTIVASKKDFIRVEWTLDERLPHQSRDWQLTTTLTSDGTRFRSPAAMDSLRGYRVRYQAIGSSYVQSSAVLGTDVRGFDIQSLHENTLYNICVRAIYDTVTTDSVDDGSAVNELKCVKGTTQTDSLFVALGSTLGAFVALSIIILLVFFAKRQHRLRQKSVAYQSQLMSSYRRSCRDCTTCDEATQQDGGSVRLLTHGDQLYLQLRRDSEDGGRGGSDDGGGREGEGLYLGLPLEDGEAEELRNTYEEGGELYLVQLDVSETEELKEGYSEEIDARSRYREHEQEQEDLQ